ncbi:MAG: nucleotidyltransferase domain-containing protein [Nanoarchaeota archaeon]|nr:nucleotidyltransferase domain-containing protein [Nanoarchaeota archaeon]
MGKKEFIKVIENFVTKLSKDFDIKRVIFFGSRVSGKARKDSDVDLIIVSNDFEGMSFFERGARMYDYWTEEIPVDFLCFTEKEFNKLKKRISIVSGAITSGLSIR